MLSLQPFRSAASWCRLRLFLLAFIWCLSLGSGTLFAYFTRDVTVSLMCTAPSCRVSIFSLVVTLLFPLLLSAAAVYFSIPDAIYPAVILKGISLGYCLLGSVMAYGNAGWLVCSLLTFSQTLMSVPLMWFWTVCLSGNAASFKKGFLICFTAALIIGITDYFVVSAFLITLVS